MIELPLAAEAVVTLRYVWAVVEVMRRRRGRTEKSEENSEGVCILKMVE